MQQRRLAIIGAGALGQHLAYYAATDGHYQVAGFFDDFRPPFESVGYTTVLGTTADVDAVYRSGAFDVLMIGIGYRHMALRRALFERFATVVPMGQVVHSSCFVDASCRIGAGAFLLPGCVLDRSAVLHDNVLLHAGCTIAHDSSVGAHSFLAPRVAVAGFAQIGADCFLGINTTVIDGVTIGPGIQTGGGTVVIEDLPAPGLYVGNPARLIR